MSIDQYPQLDVNYAENSLLWNGQGYSRGTYNITATGFTTTVNGTVQWVRLGQLMVMTIPTFQGISNTDTFTLTGFPTNITGYGFAMPVAITNGGVNAIGLWEPPSGAGIIRILRDIVGTPWTSSGTKVLWNGVLTYILN